MDAHLFLGIHRARHADILDAIDVVVGLHRRIEADLVVLEVGRLRVIIDLRLEDVRRLLAERKISIELTDAAKELLFTEGFDPNFGAPPLKRAIQKLIQDPLALKILDGEVLHGDHTVVDADKNTGKLRFEVSRRVGEPVKPAR